MVRHNYSILGDPISERERNNNCLLILTNQISLCILFFQFYSELVRKENIYNSKNFLKQSLKNISDITANMN
jgi:hypothetical protein